MFDREAFVKTIREEGCAVIPSLLDADTVARLKAALVRAIDAEIAWHGRTDYVDFGMVMVCPMYDRAFSELLADPRIMDPTEAVLGEGCIVYAYTSSSMPPSSGNYSTRIHVDSPRVIPGYVTNMGIIVSLDDFTEENGATWFLPRSHERADAPSKEEFFAGARRFVAPAGSAFYFNARTWHYGGENRTNAWRHGMTINICRPYMKQRLDLPRLLAGRTEVEGLPEKALQKLGFRSQVPASLEEYYAPPGQRKYSQRIE